MLKDVKIWSIAGFGPDTSRFPTAVILDTFSIQNTNDSAALNFVRHGQFQENDKKTPTT